MIREISCADVLEFAGKFFSDFKNSSDPFEKIYGYFDNDDLIGFISISSIYERCEINYLAVSENYRRKGIAQKLFNRVIGLNDYDSVSLEVRADNLIAINFYKKNGFKIVTVRHKYYGDIDGYLMVR